MQKMNAENGDVLLFIADTDKALVNDDVKTSVACRTTARVY